MHIPTPEEAERQRLAFETAAQNRARQLVDDRSNKIALDKIPAIEALSQDTLANLIIIGTNLLPYSAAEQKAANDLLYWAKKPPGLAPIALV